MSYRRHISSLILLMLTLLLPVSVAARRNTKDSFPKKKKKKEEKRRDDFAAKMKGLLEISASDSCAAVCPDSVVFSGYDKPASGDKETFLVSNRTAYSLQGLRLQISYYSIDDRLMHRRLLELPCDIPAGETRKLDVRSFDTQHSYHYAGSSPGRSGATPFRVAFTPLTLWLK